MAHPRSKKAKKRLTWLLVLAMAFLLLCPVTGATSDGDEALAVPAPLGGYDQRSLFVKLSGSAGLSIAAIGDAPVRSPADALAQYGKTTFMFQTSPSGSNTPYSIRSGDAWYYIELDEDRDLDDVMDELMQAPGVIAVDYNYKL